MTTEQEYKEFLKGKRVAVVGPSKTVMMQEQGPQIESCDVVVRLNNMLNFDKRYEKHLGQRTDVVYATLDDPPYQIARDCEKNAVKYLSSSYPENEWFFAERMAHNVNALKEVKNFSTAILPENPYWDIKRETNSRPNTGFSAILDLLSSDLKELHIIGIDFYRSAVLDSGAGYYDGYSCQWTDKRKMDFVNIEYDGPDRHNPDEAFKYFKYNMFLKDSRIKVDPIFGFFLKDRNYENLINLLDN